jgi:1-acyl-sn-glycerol-3-phosphate acyltransferase
VQAFYGLFVWFLRVVTSLFFRTIEVVGADDVPADGPVILVGNHPNSLIDPVLITITCGRKLHFLAKDTLFEWRALRLLLSTLGAVPVRRRQDHAAGAEGKLDNASAFDALFALLREGGACGIFPEGISHASSELAPLKTGAARIALGAARELEGKQTVRIVPCGLTYRRRTRMRGQVLVQYGRPLELSAAHLAAHREDERAAVVSLTAEIEDALRALTINAPDFETLRVLEGVRRLYTAGERLPLDRHAELTRRFMQGWEQHQDEPEVQQLYGAVERYVQDVRDLGLTEREIGRRLSVGWIAVRVIRHLVLMLVLAPLAIPGIIIHAPALLVAVLAGDGLTARRDVVATTKVMTTALLIPVAWALIALGVWWWAPEPHRLAATAVTLLGLPLTGLATIRVLGQTTVLRRSLWVLVMLFALRKVLRRLKERRAQLVEAIWSAVDRYVDPDLERILPPKTATDGP